VFSYIGLTFFSFLEYEWSLHFFIAMTTIIAVGRFIGTIGVIKVAECFGFRSGFQMKELVFISYAGMIRGAVSFGLVLRIDDDIENRPVIVTTALLIVCFTTVVFGCTVSTVSSHFFGKDRDE
jgi:NhaP-type Na+/H+ or K+/H+ antiporter